MTKICNIDDLKAQAIAVHGNQKKYNFSNLDEMIEKLEELDRLNILIDALDKIANEERGEIISSAIAKLAIQRFKTK
jgi:hypothetical protein